MIAELERALANDQREEARTLALALAGTPPFGASHLTVAQALFGLGEVAASLRLLDALVEFPALRERAADQRFRYQVLLGRLHEALAADLPSPRLQLRAADLLARRDHPRGALTHLDRVMPASSPALHMARADALVEMGEWEAAAQAALAAAAHPDYRAAAARLLLRAGAFTEAESLAQEAPDVLAHLALFRGQPRDLGDLDADGGWEARVWRGERHLRRGEYPAAIDCFQSAAEAAPGLLVSAHMLRLLATIRARAADPRWRVGGPDAWGEVAGALVALFPDAQPILDSDDPHAIGALLERALAKMQGNRTVAPSFVENGRLQPLRFRPGPRYAARRLLNLVATAPAAEILGEFAPLVAAHPRSGLPRCYRAELNLWLGDSAAARADLEPVLAHFPDTRWAYIGLATVEMLTGNLERALELIALGIARKHGTMGPPAWAIRGEILRRLGRLPEAIADLEKACELTPRRASAHLNLALAYAATQRQNHHILEKLRRQAAPLLEDADDDLEAALQLMQGNRSSSGITWKPPDRPLRFLFFDDRASEGLAEIQAHELRLAKAALEAR